MARPLLHSNADGNPNAPLHGLGGQHAMHGCVCMPACSCLCAAFRRLCVVTPRVARAAPHDPGAASPRPCGRSHSDIPIPFTITHAFHSYHHLGGMCIDARVVWSGTPRVARRARASHHVASRRSPRLRRAPRGRRDTPSAPLLPTPASPLPASVLSYPSTDGRRERTTGPCCCTFRGRALMRSSAVATSRSCASPAEGGDRW